MIVLKRLINMTKNEIIRELQKGNVIKDSYKGKQYRLINDIIVSEDSNGKCITYDAIPLGDKNLYFEQEIVEEVPTYFL